MNLGLFLWLPQNPYVTVSRHTALAVLVIRLGGDCLVDITVLRDQPDLAGPVSRLVKNLVADGPRALTAIRAAARRPASGRGCWLGTTRPVLAGWSPSTWDATIVIAH
jgi:hypothetical protein